MEDRISGGLQHRHMMCCEKGGRRGRRACRVQRWHHRGDVVFRTGGLVYDIGLDSREETGRIISRCMLIACLSYSVYIIYSLL